MRDRLLRLMYEGDLESGCVYGDCDLEFIADYLLDNGVIVPPCNVGDTVYLIDFEEEEWDEATVDEIVITGEGIEINSDYEIGTPSECDYIAYSEEEAYVMLAMWRLAELEGE
jgi:hypothetical protein